MVFILNLNFICWCVNSIFLMYLGIVFIIKELPTLFKLDKNTKILPEIKLKYWVIELLSTLILMVGYAMENSYQKFSMHILIFSIIMIFIGIWQKIVKS